VPVLVLPDSQAEAAAELCQLQQLESQQQQQQQLALQEGKQQAAPAASAADVVRLVAAVLCYLQQRQEAEAAGPHTAAASTFEAAYPPTAIARLALAARWLVALAVRARWPAVARLMLPGVTADGSSTAAALQQLNDLSGPAPGLAHLAVASGSAASLAALRSWAGAEGAAWGLAPAGGTQPAGSVEPLQDLLLVAAAMGSSLSADMVEQLAGGWAQACAELCCDCTLLLLAAGQVVPACLPACRRRLLTAGS
jgi:hypothetical protein